MRLGDLILAIAAAFLVYGLGTVDPSAAWIGAAVVMFGAWFYFVDDGDL